jgi:CheY-like chemotaxis protein
MILKKSQSPILLVEDDINDVFFFERALRKAGVTNRLEIAKDGQEAIDLLAGRGSFADPVQFPPPCLIVLDLNLPIKTGLQVLKWIRENDALDSVPVVALTSSTSDQDMAEAYQLRANSYLVKPSDPDTLVELVRLTMDYWLRMNQRPQFD